jgi:allantoicase
VTSTVPGFGVATEPDPGSLDGFVDLASRRFGGSVVAATDETFAPKENLILPSVPTFTARTFGQRGQVYDGWETRRRREPGHDWAIVRLGLPGVVHGVVVDTAHFTGNYPESAALDGRCEDGYPGAAQLAGAADGWLSLVPRRRLRGDTRNVFAVAARQLVTHLRLTIHPDGGVARLRVYGEVVPDPRRLLDLSLDLAALENGGRVEECSNRYYSAPDNVIAPGRPATMGEGWETRRRRGEGNDWLRLRLAAAGHVRQVVLDTTHFIGNAPGAARILGCDATVADPADPASWWELLPRTRLQPDTRHWFDTDPNPRTTHARVDIYPDGGLARVRLHGVLSTDGRAELTLRWWNALPAAEAERLLLAAGLPADQAGAAAAGRPDADLPDPLRAELLP